MIAIGTNRCALQTADVATMGQGSRLTQWYPATRGARKLLGIIMCLGCNWYESLKGDYNYLFVYKYLARDMYQKLLKILHFTNNISM